ncbi:hypothetical protein FQR65_LT13396 [Abscondita terminalis]|nr:hypothetical protein FQR65_LT13396 [Abscondita terminalis]
MAIESTLFCHEYVSKLDAHQLQEYVNWTRAQLSISVILNKTNDRNVLEYSLVLDIGYMQKGRYDIQRNINREWTSSEGLSVTSRNNCLREFDLDSDKGL